MPGSTPKSEAANATIGIVRPLRITPSPPDKGRGGPRSADKESGPRLLITVAEAAHRLGIGRSLLYELLADGQLESIHVGRLRRIPAEALAAFIDGRRQHDEGDAI